MRNIENEELVKSMYGFGGGFFLGKTCGILVGGAGLISMYMEDTEESTEKTKRMVQEFTQWFEEEFGSTECSDLRKEEREEMIIECGNMIEKSFNKIMTMLSEEGIDIYQ